MDVIGSSCANKADDPVLNQSDTYLDIIFSKYKDYNHVLIKRQEEVSAGFSYWQQRCPQHLDLLKDSFMLEEQKVQEISVLAMYYNFLHNILLVTMSLLK